VGKAEENPTGRVGENKTTNMSEYTVGEVEKWEGGNFFN
jgi:hypothetical protein